jgi:hypothetical protein
MANLAGHCPPSRSSCKEISISQGEWNADYLKNALRLAANEIIKILQPFRCKRFSRSVKTA